MENVKLVLRQASAFMLVNCPWKASLLWSMSCTEIHCKTYKFTSYVNDNDINLNIPIAIVNVSIYSESTADVWMAWTVTWILFFIAKRVNVFMMCECNDSVQVEASSYCWNCEKHGMVMCEFKQKYIRAWKIVQVWTKLWKNKPPRDAWMSITLPFMAERFSPKIWRVI